MRLEIDRIAKDESQLLGPGKRVEIWLHGCGRGCPGCIVEKHNSRPDGLMTLSVELLAGYVGSDPEIEGVTISGGEPFLQEEALLELVKLLHRNGLGVILYSGYTYKELSERPLAGEILQYTDVLIDGPYIRELDDGKAFRGSSNQKINQLTQRYRGFYSDAGRKRECRIEQKGSLLLLTGIPDEGSRQIWKRMKQKGEKI